MKPIGTPLTVGNITRLACLVYAPHLDAVNGVIDYMDVVVQARSTNANVGATEAKQIANSYAPVSLRITDSACDTYLANGAGAGNFNQYTDALVKGSAVLTGCLTAVLAAIAAANTNQKHDACLTALSVAGALPALS